MMGVLMFECCSKHCILCLLCDVWNSIKGLQSQLEDPVTAYVCLILVLQVIWRPTRAMWVYVGL